MKGPANLLAALGLAAVVGTGTGVVVQHDQDAQQRAYEAQGGEVPRSAPPSERLQAAIDEVLRDGVHVADDARWMVSAEAERRIEQAAATTDHRVFTIVWTPSRAAGEYLDADAKLEKAFAGQPTVVYIWEGPEQGEVIVVDARIEPQEFYSGYDFVGDPAVTLPKAVLSAEQATWETREDTESGGSFWGGPVSRVMAGVVIGLGATACALVALGLLSLIARRRALPGRWLWS